MCECACEIFWKIIHGMYLKLFMECILWGKGLHCQILGFYKCLNSHISSSLKSFYASFQKAKVSSNVSQTKRPSVFSESASVNASLSVAVSGPSYSSKSEPTSQSVTVSLGPSASQSQRSALSSSTSFSRSSILASENGYSSISDLKSTSPSVSHNISASKSESFRDRKSVV